MKFGVQENIICTLCVHYLMLHLAWIAKGALSQESPKCEILC